MSLLFLKAKAPMGLMLKVVTELLPYIVIVQLFFPGFGRLVLGLLSVCLDYCYICFILSLLDSSYTFLASEMELFMAVVNDLIRRLLSWIAPS